VSAAAIERATASWGQLPDWVRALAEECGRTTQSAAAKRIRYSPSVVNQVLGNSYAGDILKVEEAVRGALLGARVTCPVLGDIKTTRCHEEQGKQLSSSSPMRVKLYRACRSGCPHSRIKGGSHA